MSTTVSTVIPTRDRAELLARAIRSVEAQTRPADEIVVVDDGSRDGTVELLAREFPRVRCLRLSPRGVSAARNHGIRAARGEWIALLDSDDEWLPDKLEAQLEALATSRPEPCQGGCEAPSEHFLICHSDEIWIRNGRRVNPRQRHAKQGGYIFRHCLPLCAISPSSVLIHRSVFERLGTFDESMPACEDYDLWLRICAVLPVLYVDRPLIRKYGGHADQLSRTVPALDRWRIHALVKIVEGGELKADDHRAAVAMLAEKIAIYRQGALKRGRIHEADALAEIEQRFPVL